MLPRPSREQQIIINKYRTGNNLSIQAVAGAGKTTTLLMLARANSAQNILIITYSKRLQIETEARAKEFTNVTVKTIHAAAGHAYGITIKDDKALSSYKNISIKPNSPINRYNAIYLDEAQDVDHELYLFIRKITYGKQLVIVGDSRQCIFEFKGATSGYLEKPAEYFNNGRGWDISYLRDSYRFGPRIANFVNNHFKGIGSNIPINGCGNTEGKINIIVKNRTKLIKAMVNAAEMYGINNIALIANKVRTTYIEQIGIGFTKRTGYDYVLIDGDNKNKEDEYINDRLYIGTIHSMKGLERNVIFVVMDENYFHLYDAGKWCHPDLVPNIVYVAMTRAKHEIVWFIDKCNDIIGLRSIDMTTIEDDVDNIDGKLDITNRLHPIDRYKSRYNTSVCDTLDYRVPTDISQMIGMLKINNTSRYKKTTDYHDILNIPYITMCKDKGKDVEKNNLENVSSYYGITVPIVVEYKLTGNLFGYRERIIDAIFDECYDKYKKKLGITNKYELKDKIRTKDGDIINKIKDIKPEILTILDEKTSTSDLLNILESLIDNKMLINKLKLIDQTTTKTPVNIMELVCLLEMISNPSISGRLGDLRWINQDFLQAMCDRLEDYITKHIKSPKFEQTVSLSALHPYLRYLNQPTENGDQIKSFISGDPDGISAIKKYLGVTENFITTYDASSLSNKQINLNGRIDCVGSDGLYEFKLTTSTSDEHLLQLATYMAMKGIEVGHLVNILTGMDTMIMLRKESHDQFLRVLFHKVTNWDNINHFDRPIDYDNEDNSYIDDGSIEDFSDDDDCYDDYESDDDKPNDHAINQSRENEKTTIIPPNTTPSKETTKSPFDKLQAMSKIDYRVPTTRSNIITDEGESEETTKTVTYDKAPQTSQPKEKYEKCELDKYTRKEGLEELKKIAISLGMSNPEANTYKYGTKKGKGPIIDWILKH